MFLEDESRHQNTPKFRFPLFFKRIFSLNLLLYEQVQSVLQGLCVTTGIKQTIEAHLSLEHPCKKGQIGSLE